MSHSLLVTCIMAFRLHFVTTFGLGGGSLVAPFKVTALRSATHTTACSLGRTHLTPAVNSRTINQCARSKSPTESSCHTFLPTILVERTHPALINLSLLQVILALVLFWFLGIETWLGVLSRTQRPVLYYHPCCWMSTWLNSQFQRIFSTNDPLNAREKVSQAMLTIVFQK